MQQHQQIFFVLGLVVAIPVLVYYYRRPGHRRFRPKIGEMAMVCLFTVLLCGGGAILLGSFLDDPDQYKVRSDLSVAPSYVGGNENGEAGENADGSRKTEDRTSRDGDNRDRGSRNDDAGGGPGEKTRRD